MAKRIGYTQEYFIGKAREIHGDKYNYDKIGNIAHTSDKVCIVCPRHGEFWQEAYNHLHGNGCLKCYHDSLKIKSRSNTQRFIEKARKKHGDFFDYSKVEYTTGNEPVCIICPKHGEFWQTPRNHLVRRGCPQCSKEAIHIKNSDSQDEFIMKAKKIHGDKYDYSKVVYNTQESDIVIICPKHGEFIQKAAYHLTGNGCPKCGRESTIKSLFKTTDEFIEDAKKVHGDRYDYSKTNYKGCYEKVCIICPKHGEFWQTPAKHLSGCGCPKCLASRGEEAILLFCKEHGIDYQSQFMIQIQEDDQVHNLAYDFYIPRYNLLIEYQGEPHYRFVKHFHKTQEKFNYRRHLDFLKYQYALEHGYNFIPIPYWDLNHLDSILTELLLDNISKEIDEKYSDWT